MIPGEVVHFIERVIVVVRGVIGGCKGRTVQGQRLIIIGRQQITAHIRIRIARAREGILRRPRHRPHAIEQPSSTHSDRRHFLHIIGSSQIVARQLFGLQGTAIAVDLHLRGIRKTCFLQQSVGEMIDPTLRDTDLRPRTFAQHGVRSISFALSCPPHISTDS